MRARSVGVGVLVTYLVLAALAIYRELPGHAPLPLGAFVPLSVAAAAGALVMLVLPWPRLLAGRWGLLLFCGWSLLDIALISVLVAISGAGHSPLWALYLLTTVFFASSYPWRAQLVLLTLTGTAYGITIHVAGHGAAAATIFLRLVVLLMVWMLAAFLSRELQRAQARLLEQEWLAAVGETAATVAHELRNPLGVVTNVVYLLAEHAGRDDVLRRHLDTARREVGAASRVVSDLLEFARPRDPLPREVDLAALVTETTAAYPPPPAVRLLTDIAPDLPVLACDPDQVGHVLRSLLSNAYDAVAEADVGGDTVHVAVTADRHRARLTVTDDGPGLSAEASAGLFEPFTTTKARGIGLGLVVASRLVSAQHGTLTVDSTPGGGTAVTVTLPLPPDPVVPAQPERRERPAVP